jgi:hypothetical protein
MHPMPQVPAVGLEQVPAERPEAPRPAEVLGLGPARVRREERPAWVPVRVRVPATMGWAPLLAAPMPAQTACQIHPVTA